jgi:fibro-slime domain-containing protein
MHRIFTAAAVCLFGCLPGLAEGASLTLTATIRDFNFNGTSQNGATGHVDFQNVGSVLDPGIVATTLGADGKPVYAGPTAAAVQTTHGAAAFNQWYNDTPGVNLATSYTFIANETSPGSGVYKYTTPAGGYFPIDNQLLGNQAVGGFNHNYSFTTELHTTFIYQPGQDFSFTGDDDLFLFIDKKLVIDLGGVHTALTRSVDLDTLALIVGQRYSLDLFGAERHSVASNFSFTTSIALENAVATPVPAALPLFAGGLGVVAVLGRRRNRS